MFGTKRDFSTPCRACWVFVFVGACLVSQRALAHTSLEKYVREAVSVFVGPGNIDIRIRFSFPASLSLIERQQMDINGDGQFSTKEQETYLDTIQARTEQLLRLSVNGQVVVLIPLADPVLDVQDAPDVHAHPHELSLAYFARVPENFGVDSTIVLDSALWADVPLMISVSTEGADGIRLQTTETQGLRPPSGNGPPSKDAAFRILEGRCTQWEPGDKKSGRK